MKNQLTSSLTPQQVIDTLASISKDIDDTTRDIARLDEALVRARVAHEVAYAKSFLSIEGSMDVRRYTAVLETQGSRLELEIAEQKHRAAVGSLRALRDRLEVGRSISPLVRLEWGMS